MNGPVTPVLTHHARERCAEMGISTKVAKRIWQCATVTRPAASQHKTAAGAGEGRVATCVDYPDYAVLFLPDACEDGRPLIMTVLYQLDEAYEAAGRGWDSKKRFDRGLDRSEQASA